MSISFKSLGPRSNKESSSLWTPLASWASYGRVIGGLLLIFQSAVTAQVTTNHSIARDWDEQILSAIRIDKPHPPVHARNLFSLSVCMYDAWAAYSTVEVGYVYRGKASSPDLGAARHEAISFAAYRMLKERYALSKSAPATLAALNAHMAALGYDTNNVSRDVSTPAGLGNSVYDAVSAWFLNDGSYQTNGYKDLPASKGGYSPVNAYLNTGLPGVEVIDVNHWQPLEIANALDQNGLPTGPLQVFLGSQWLWVRPFALSREDSTKAWIDPGPPPLLGTESTDAFRTNVVEVIRRSSQLTPDDGVVLDISPGSFGNNSLGANDGVGHPVNPVTGLAYPSNLVKRGNFARVLAEYFADGPDSETPPGHWNVLANRVADDPSLVKRIGGIGPIVDDLEWDVKVYFALNAAVHEAACAAWALKREYDGWRPLSAVRYMGHLGQSSDPTMRSYHTNGLPLIPDLIEIVTANTSAPGGKHVGLPIGKVVIRAWAGQPANPATQYGGIKWLQPGDWIPYQKTNFVTPPFPGYISGHSTFSRAAAEVLTAITGSPFFPGGLGTFTAIAGAELKTEYGPSETVQLQWGTYYDAADQAGVSRLWGGIHPPIDDFTGRVVGSQCGKGVWQLASRYFDGSISNLPIHLAIESRGSPTNVIRFNTSRGLFYKTQTKANLGDSFADSSGGFQQAFDASASVTNLPNGGTAYYRVISSLVP